MCGKFYFFKTYINIMKKYFFYAALAVALTASCQKAQKNSVEIDPLDDGTPVPVMMGTNVVTASVKAPVSSLASTTVKVFAIDNSVNATGEYDYLLNDEAVAVGADATSPIKITDKYYGESLSYSFYGYYVAGLATQITAGTDGVASTPLTITGQEDILLAKADPDADISGNPKVTSTTRVYSAYSARRGVKPTLKFEHQLTCLEFVLQAGESAAENVTVDKMTFTAKTDMNLTITGSGQGLSLADNAENKTITLFDAIDGTATEVSIPTYSASSPESNIADFGANPKSIMIFETAEAVKGHFFVSQSGATTSPIDRELTIPAPEGGFKKGYKYTVTIAVYGVEPIIVSVALTPWGNGGSIIIDSDADDYQNPTWNTGA